MTVELPPPLLLMLIHAKKMGCLSASDQIWLKLFYSVNLSKMVSIPLPTFDTPFSSPLEEKLTSDGKSATGKITILPGVKVDGVAGGTTTIGGISSTVKVNKLEDGCIICFCCETVGKRLVRLRQ